ncbi:MAG: zinc ribbon domain-containing protein [Candidatus Heimdallarchaeota archaeon]|nr:MAG: zinc ribbon domain-containing protein [Candidatus Heimdallarchaeota archaeon]
MDCMKCGHTNEPNAKFCRQCGSALTIPKGEQVEFVPTKRVVARGDNLCFGEEAEPAPGIIVGVVFIVLSIIIAVAIFMPVIFSDFGNFIGTFFGGFGETMGQIGSDFGEFMGNWGENFGEAVGTFFSGVVWWEILQVLIVLAFLIIGIVLIVVNMRKR